MTSQNNAADHSLSSSTLGVSSPKHDVPDSTLEEIPLETPQESEDANPKRSSVTTLLIFFHFITILFIGFFSVYEPLFLYKNQIPNPRDNLTASHEWAENNTDSIPPIPFNASDPTNQKMTSEIIKYYDKNQQLASYFGANVIWSLIFAVPLLFLVLCLIHRGLNRASKAKDNNPVLVLQLFRLRVLLHVLLVTGYGTAIIGVAIHAVFYRKLAFGADLEAFLEIYLPFVCSMMGAVMLMMLLFITFFVGLLTSIGADTMRKFQMEMDLEKAREQEPSSNKIKADETIEGIELAEYPKEYIKEDGSDVWGQ